MVFSLQSEIRAQNLPNDPRGRIDRGRCDPLLRRQLQHPLVPLICDVQVAGGIHRHALGSVEAGEWQHGLALDPAANFTTLLLPIR